MDHRISPTGLGRPYWFGEHIQPQGMQSRNRSTDRTLIVIGVGFAVLILIALIAYFVSQYFPTTKRATTTTTYPDLEAAVANEPLAESILHLRVPGSGLRRNSKESKQLLCSPRPRHSVSIPQPIYSAPIPYRTDPSASPSIHEDPPEYSSLPNLQSTGDDDSPPSGGNEASSVSTTLSRSLDVSSLLSPVVSSTLIRTLSFPERIAKRIAPSLSSGSLGGRFSASSLENLTGRLYHILVDHTARTTQSGHASDSVKTISPCDKVAPTPVPASEFISDDRIHYTGVAPVLDDGISNQEAKLNPTLKF